MKITSKYILREHLGPLTFALGALTSLLLLNYIARKFGDLVGKGLPWEVIAKFFFLSIPFTIAMTLPMAVLVSVLYAFSRLAGENEITAFKASGVSMGRLLGPVLWAATVLAAGMILFNDQVLPRANHTLSVLTQDIARTTPTFALKPRVLNEVTESVLIQANDLDPVRNTMRQVTIYDMSQQSPRTIRADSGALGLMKNGRDLQLTLYDGEIEQVGEGRTQQLQRIFYETQLLRVRDVVREFPSSRPGENQFKSDREMSICELQQAYLRSRTEYLRARLELDIAIADSAKRPAPKSSGQRRVFLGLGRLYCQAVHAISSLAVSEAKAQAPVGQPPAGQPPATQPTTQPTTQPPATQPPAAQPPVTPAARPQPPADTARRDTTPRDTTRRDTTRSDTARAPVPAPPPAVPPATVLPSTLPPSTGVVPPSTGAVPPPPAPTAGDTAAQALATPPPATAAPVPSTEEPQTGVFGTSVLQLARLRVTETLGAMNSYDVEIHKKFALAVACIVFVLLGAPIALRFPRGGVGLVIGVSLFVFAAYYSFLIAGEELASRGMLPPWLSMWAANVLFAAAGIPLVLRMGQGGGSARGGGIGEWLDNVRYRFRQRRRKPAATARS